MMVQYIECAPKEDQLRQVIDDQMTRLHCHSRLKAAVEDGSQNRAGAGDGTVGILADVRIVNYMAYFGFCLWSGFYYSSLGGNMEGDLDIRL